MDTNCHWCLDIIEKNRMLVADEALEVLYISDLYI